MQTRLTDYDYENMTLYELAESILKSIKHEDEMLFKRRGFYITKTKCCDARTIVRDQSQHK